MCKINLFTRTIGYMRDTYGFFWWSPFPLFCSDGGLRLLINLKNPAIYDKKLDEINVNLSRLNKDSKKYNYNFLEFFCGVIEHEILHSVLNNSFIDKEIKKKIKKKFHEDSEHFIINKIISVDIAREYSQNGG